MITNNIITTTSPEPTWYWTTPEWRNYWAGTQMFTTDTYVTRLSFYLQGASTYPQSTAQYSMLRITGDSSSMISDDDAINSDSHSPMIILPYRGLQGKMQDCAWCYRRNGTESNTYEGQVLVSTYGKITQTNGIFTLYYNGRNIDMECKVNNQLGYWKIHANMIYSISPFYSTIQ